MIFNISGHENVLSTHRSTVEFTKHKHLTKRGDCILGVDADYSFSELKNIIKEFKRAEIIIRIEGLEEKITADLNRDFGDDEEMVMRRSDFMSKRTLGINADKAAIDIDRRIVRKLQNRNARAEVEIKGI